MSPQLIQSDIEPRKLRALTEPMSVLPDMGRAKDADDLYLVVSSSAKGYLVDAQDWACECPDATYRDARCKHQWLVALFEQSFDVVELEEKLNTTATDMETSAEQLREKAQELEFSAGKLRDAIDRLEEVKENA